MPIGFGFPTNQLPYWLLAAALIVAACIVALRWLERRRQVRLARFVDLKLGERLLPGFDVNARRPMFWLTAIGLVCLAIAFLQPHWGQAWQEVHQRSHDVLIVLDTSESMLAENPLPNRLERSKQKILSLLERTPGDRFGLVVFSGAAELMCPLTVDLGYFRSVLNAVDTNSISLEGTDIAAALEVATDTFRDQEEETGDYSRDSRAILLVSDGEAVTGDALKSAENAANFARIFVIGVGDPRGAEVTYNTPVGRRTLRDDEGQPHLSKLDEEALSRIALAGGGGYTRSTPGNSDIDSIYGLVQQLAARDVSGELRLQLVNRYQWPLAIAIVCFAAEGVWLALLPWMRERRARKLEAASGELSHA